MRVFKNKPFARFARKAGLTDSALMKAVAEAERGLVDAVLGGGVIKQRVAREGGGKSGGFPTIILFRLGEMAFFVHGFAKSDLTISATMNWPPSKCWPPKCWLMMTRP